MNRERLTTFETLLRNIRTMVPTITYFDMGDWIDRTRTDEKNEVYDFPLVKLQEDHTCGTAACALGSAGLYKPFRDQGLITTVDCVVFKPDPETDETQHYGFVAGAEFFDITIEQSKLLFSTHSYEEGVTTTPEMVADRVKQILDGTAPELMSS